MKNFTFVLLTAVLTLAPALADSTHGDAGHPHKGSICHATHSSKNPYVLITVDRSADSAHLAHQDTQDDVYNRNLGTRSGPTDEQTCTDNLGDIQ